MRVTIHGVRGTSAVTGPSFAGFGGDTTSLLVEGAAGERICLDAGTGIIHASRHLAQQVADARLLLLLTHFHLDHIMGLGSLSQLYDGKWRVEIAAPPCGDVSLPEAVTRILARPFWPLQVTAMKAGIELTELPAENSLRPRLYGGLEVRWCAVHHFEGCTAYRVDEPATGASFVFATDLEWGESSPAEKKALLDLCARPSTTRLLICDGQYTGDHYPQHVGWGHSSVEDAVEIARHSAAGKLLVTHHAPDRDDQDLESVQERLTGLLPSASLARQGLVIEL